MGSTSKSDAHKSHLGFENAPFQMMKEATRVTGGQFIEWDPDGAMHALVNIDEQFKDDFFPDAFFSDSFSRIDLDEIRVEYAKMKTTKDPKASEAIGIQITSKLRNAIFQYEQNHPLDRQILSRLRAFKRFYFQRAAILIPFPKRENQTMIQLSIKAFYTVFYWVIMLIGSLGLLKNVFLRPSQFGYFFGGITGYILVLFPIVIIASEQRYIAIAYMMIIPFVAQMLSRTEPESLFDAQAISKQY